MPKDTSPKTGQRASDALFDKLLRPGQEGGSLQATMVFTKLIQPNPRQPRKEIDPDAFELLVSSIAAKGIQHPLLVRPQGRSYELIAGQRRLLAAQRLELAEVPVIVREMGDVEALEAAIIENLTREDLNPVDETDSILQLISLELDRPVGETVTLLYRMQRTLRGRAHNVMGAAELGTEEKIIERVFGGLGKMTWASFVQNRLPILSYSDDLLDAVRTGQLSYTKAKELARVLDKDVRRPLLERVIGEALSLEETKRLVAAASEQKEPVSDYQHLAGLRKQLSPKRLDQLDARKRKQVDILLEKLRKILDPE